MNKLIKIKLNNDYYGFALILDKTFITFFDYFTNKDEVNIESLIKKPILFTNAVSYKQALKSGEWKVIGQTKVEEAYFDKKPYYIQDPIEKDKFFISHPPDYSKMEEATKNECLGLEKMLVYYPEHVVDRLNHHFFNTKIKWKSSLPFWLDEVINGGNNSK